MAELEPSELDLAAAFRAYLSDAPTEVRPAELARQFAVAHPHGRTASAPWRLVATPRPAWLLLIVAALLATLIGGMLVIGSQQVRRLPAVVPSVAPSAPRAFACPPGSTPDTPGPAAQARPPAGPMAFDRESGRIVLVADTAGTWTFDVCANTWARMLPSGSRQAFPSLARSSTTSTPT